MCVCLPVFVCASLSLQKYLQQRVTQRITWRAVLARPVRRRETLVVWRLGTSAWLSRACERLRQDAAAASPRLDGAALWAAAWALWLCQPALRRPDRAWQPERLVRGRAGTAASVLLLHDSGQLSRWVPHRRTRAARLPRLLPMRGRLPALPRLLRAALLALVAAHVACRQLCGRRGRGCHAPVQHRGLRLRRLRPPAAARCGRRALRLLCAGAPRRLPGTTRERARLEPRARARRLQPG